MKIFRDKTGREWAVTITHADIARVMDLARVDLTKILQQGGVVEDQLQNPSTHLSVICAVIQPQLAERNVTPQAFSEHLDEEAIEAADEAIYLETIAYFREPKRSMLLKAFQRLMAAARTVKAEATEAISEALESLDFEKVARAAVAGKDSAGNLPELSESTPVPARSAS